MLSGRVSPGCTLKQLSVFYGILLIMCQWMQRQFHTFQFPTVADINVADTLIFDVEATLVPFNGGS
jgi:hypothetical protein